MMARTRPFFLLVGAGVAAIASGCTFSAPQFDSGFAIAEGVVAAKENASIETEESPDWLASFEGRGAVLNPYLLNGFVVFANADGDAIAFDGWIVRSVVGFGLEDPLSISGKVGVRALRFSNQKMVTMCDEWILIGLIWRQTCANGVGEIALDNEGYIQKITMAIGNRSSVLTLQVAK